MLWSGIILIGSLSYMILSSDNKEVKTEVKTEVKEEVKSNYDKTYLYFSNLTLDEQIEYMNYNLDLKDYKDILTDNRYFNSKKIAAISEKMGKEFTNKDRKY